MVPAPLQIPVLFSAYCMIASLAGAAMHSCWAAPSVPGLRFDAV